MGRLLGGMIAVYLIYALFAAAFRHKAGIIIAAIINLASGIVVLAFRGDYFTIMATICAISVIYYVPKIQIRNSNK